MFLGFDLIGRTYTLETGADTFEAPDEFLKNCILVSADLESMAVDLDAEEIVLNSFNGKLKINIAYTPGAILRLEFKKYAK